MRRRKRGRGGLGLFTVLLVGIALGLTAIASRQVSRPEATGAAGKGTGTGTGKNRSGRPSTEVYGVPLDGGHAGDTATSTRTSEGPVAPGTDDVMRVHFYDVSEGLAVLVDLPGGEHVLVDAGDAPAREGCGDDCSRAHQHLLESLTRDLGGAAIDLLWITHQHSDHIGGARDILSELPVRTYVDNGRDLDRAEVRTTHDAARRAGAHIVTVDPSHARIGVSLLGPARLLPVVPDAWPRGCEHDPNDCSIGLRVELGVSSVLFTGDAEREEERALPIQGKVTLLQVGHHGSQTSTSEAFLARVAPRYAVISAGHPGVGMNADYCLPRTTTLERLNRALGGDLTETLQAYDSRVTCRRASASDWVAVPVSDRLWATERDGDVVLVTRGDGVFTRENSPD